MPVAEIRFDGFPATKPAIVGYAAKWHADSFEYRNTVRSFGVEPELAARAARLSLACWQLFALDGYARVDFRVDGSGMLYVLEVNANPCLSPDAGFAAALEQAGIGYADAIGWLIADARRRAAPQGARRVTSARRTFAIAAGRRPTTWRRCAVSSPRRASSTARSAPSRSSC